MLDVLAHGVVGPVQSVAAWAAGAARAPASAINATTRKRYGMRMTGPSGGGAFDALRDRGALSTAGGRGTVSYRAGGERRPRGPRRRPRAARAAPAPSRRRARAGRRR